MGAVTTARQLMTQHHSSADDHSERTSERACYVLGGGRLGTAVARRLRSNGYPVSLVDSSADRPETSGRRGDPVDLTLLEEAGLAGASTVIVATRSDRRNLLVAQLVSARFDVPEVVVLANVPDRLDAFAEAGHDPVCATDALSDAIADFVSDNA